MHMRTHMCTHTHPHTRGDSTTTRIDAMLVDPAHARSVTAVEEASEHGLPGHNAVRYTLNINAPMQRVMKLRKLPPFSLLPRNATDLEEICTELLLPHIPQWDSLLDTGPQWTGYGNFGHGSLKK